MSKKLLILSISFVLILITSCTRVSPNMHLVYTNDCWNHINVVKAGSVKPKLPYACDKMIALPAYQMPGNVVVKTRFKNDVKGIISIDYLYEIVDPISFVKNAKFLLQADLQEDNYNKDNESIELAENTITDKIIKDIVRGLTENMDATNFNETEFETKLEKVVNDVAKSRGTILSAFSTKIDFGTQTEEAIDAISAYSLYKANGMEEVGGKIMVANSGKPQITIQEKTEIKEKED